MPENGGELATLHGDVEHPELRPMWRPSPRARLVRNVAFVLPVSWKRRTQGQGRERALGRRASYLS